MRGARREPLTLLILLSQRDALSRKGRGRKYKYRPVARAYVQSRGGIGDDEVALAQRDAALRMLALGRLEDRLGVRATQSPTLGIVGQRDRGAVRRAVFVQPPILRVGEGLLRTI